MIRKIVHLAIPNIISNITIPLVGMVDLAIVGAMGSTTLLGGIAIGTAIFNLLYWNFGFLRMGTSGLTAQAYGRRDFVEIQRVLMRSLTVACAIAALILALQVPLADLILRFMDSSPAVESAAREYFFYRVWAAPATLSLYAFKGWFIGMQNSRSPMWIAIFINVINVIASLVLAFPLGMGLAGVALGTAVAQWSGAGLAIVMLVKYYGRYFDIYRLLEGVFEPRALAMFFRLNRDIFIRTLCLVAVFTYFTKASSSMGNITLAANTLLLQLFTLFSYFMDGFAYAGEALAGRYTGSRNAGRLHRTVSAIFKVGATVAVVFSLLYLFGGQYILMIFSPEASVMEAALSSMNYVAMVPVIGFAAFLMDGLLVGMTR
ncbi:MAG: MATE family efflux transporter, partial [Mucinivorans sp.]